ncbi:cupin fold metalloprotein, WbuC family [bacterium]|nr:MAG: cupin fold metalloprotein, WbuC family [bacterium]
MSMKLALPNVKGTVFKLTNELIEQGLQASRVSERKRMVLPVHRSQDAIVQRIVNFLQPGTYIRPHKHPREHASESVYIERGAISLLIWDDEGNLLESHWMHYNSPEKLIDIEPNVWHSMLVWYPDTVLLEFKRGPYDTQEDKYFAPWSPEEGTVEAEAFLQDLIVKLRG